MTLESMAQDFAKKLADKNESTYTFSQVPTMLTKYGRLLGLKLKDIGYLLELFSCLRVTKKITH